MCDHFAAAERNQPRIFSAVASTTPALDSLCNVVTRPRSFATRSEQIRHLCCLMASCFDSLMPVKEKRKHDYVRPGRVDDLRRQRLYAASCGRAGPATRAQ